MRVRHTFDGNANIYFCFVLGWNSAYGTCLRQVKTAWSNWKFFEPINWCIIAMTSMRNTYNYHPFWLFGRKFATYQIRFRNCAQFACCTNRRCVTNKSQMQQTSNLALISTVLLLQRFDFSSWLHGRDVYIALRQIQFRNDWEKYSRWKSKMRHAQFGWSGFRIVENCLVIFANAFQTA